MTFSWPPQNAAEMLALQQKFGRDADIGAALGIGSHAVERCRQEYRLPTLPQGSWRPAKAGKNIGDRAIAEMFAGRRFR